MGGYPVPEPYNLRFNNQTGEGWTDMQRQFASAVWAQDVMVGAVLDKLEALNIEQNTVVFFSGDNGVCTWRAYIRVLRMCMGVRACVRAISTWCLGCHSPLAGDQGC